MVANLRAVAHAAGIDPDYTSWRGDPTSASDESIRAAIASLAPDLGFDPLALDPDAAIEKLLVREWSERVPPVVIAWDGELVVPIRVHADRDGDWQLSVTTEQHQTFTSHGRLFALAADSHAHPAGRVHCIRRAVLSLDNSLGYHELAWSCDGDSGKALVISAPTRAWGSPGNFDRRWGVFAPVYGLASETSGGAGDLATLRELFGAVERRGGAYVATLPILAAFLGEPGSPRRDSAAEGQRGVDEPFAFSPYSPASRLFWNELYLDLDQLGESLGIAVPKPPPQTPGLIDYRAQYAWKRPVIDRLAAAFFSDPGRTQAVAAWATANGVFDYAAFRAIGEQQRTSWRNWPAQLRDGTTRVRTRDEAIALGADGARVDAHVYAQWSMQQQLAALQGGPVSLYLDLPVGVSCDAYEVWRWRRLFLTTLAAGAPPDALFLGGQNWGLPPMSPIALRRGRYKYFIDCVRHHMRVAGMLRIDHVMGMFRLYVVPEGRAATDGVYLRYPAEDLLAIITLESSRATCAVAGEDLGTVPPHVRPAMQRHGMYRLHVGQWAFPTEIGKRSDAVPAGSIASLNTHDTATFAGWWSGADITDKLDLSLATSEEAARERAEREGVKQALLAYAPPGGSDMERAMIGVTTELADSAAEVVLVALDDLALEPVPHNVPGTTHERPNWLRRVTGWEPALDSAAITAVATARRAR